MSKHIKYRDGYKYQLVDDYVQQIPVYPPTTIMTKFLILTNTGVLSIKAGYAWDGASGPTIDTDSSMRGALIHDALYQLMREKLLDQNWRNKADEILRDTCIEDGMWGWRARMWYRSVRDFAWWAASPESRKPPRIAP